MVVSSSIPAASYIASFVQTAYGLPGTVTGKLLRSGINDTYLISAGTEQYVFRLYSLDWRTETEISEEIRLLKLLKTNDISVSYPIAKPDGGYLNELEAPEGKRFGVLFSFAEGKKISLLPVETHRKAGELMAKLHRITENLELRRIRYMTATLISEPLEEIKAFLPDTTPEMQYLRSLGDSIAEAFEAADTTAMRTGAIHLDIWFDNMNVRENGDLTLFDFDFCGNGWLCHDVAYYILQLHNVERDQTECDNKKHAFLEGYESVTPLTKEEHRMLPVIGISTYFFYLGIQCLRFENWSNVFLSEDYLKRFTNGLVKRYAEITGIYSDSL
jgi:Ser/Thr protein kinase RdoA (MazF antagonist)